MVDSASFYPITRNLRSGAVAAPPLAVGRSTSCDRGRWYPPRLPQGAPLSQMAPLPDVQAASGFSDMVSGAAAVCSPGIVLGPGWRRSSGYAVPLRSTSSSAVPSQTPGKLPMDNGPLLPKASTLGNARLFLGSPDQPLHCSSRGHQANKAPLQNRDVGMMLRRALSQVPLPNRVAPSAPPAPVLTPRSRRRSTSLSRQEKSSREQTGGSSGSRGSRRERPVSNSSGEPVRNQRSGYVASNSGGSSPSRKTKKSAEEAEDSPENVAKRAALVSFGWSANVAWSAASKRKEKKYEIKLLRPAFVGRAPVLLFSPASGSDYAPPVECSRVMSDEERREAGIVELPKMYYCHLVNKDVHEYNATLGTLAQSGFHKTNSDTGKWSLYWGPHPTPDLLRTFNPYQKANHFPSSWHLGRKDLLWRNIAKIKRQWPKDFNITPQSYVLPDDHQLWVTAREQNPNALWIYKPTNLSCGKGIKLYSSNVSSAADIKLSQKSGVVQRYVDNPLLINGFKFDFRLYVVVTSYDPLKVYINTEGLVRLATTPYSCSSDSLGERTMHLTNYSVNKHSEAYVKNEDKLAAGSKPSKGGGSKSVANLPVSLEEDEDEDDEGVGVEDDEGGGSPKSPSTPLSRSPAPGAEASEAAAASKWSFAQLREYFASTGQDYDLMMERIRDVVIKTLLAAESPIAGAWHQGASFSSIGTNGQAPLQNQTCFEIYGFDVMVDKTMTPWLLEVNVFPSLASSSPFDKRVKSQLIADTLTLVGFLPFDYDLVRNALKEEHAKRLHGQQPRQTIGGGRSQTVQSLTAASGVQDFGEAEWRLILDTHEELLRRGALERIYPTREAVEKYAPFFSTPRYANLVLQRWLQNGGERLFTAGGNTRDVPAWLPPQVYFDAY